MVYETNIFCCPYVQVPWTRGNIIMRLRVVVEEPSLDP